MPGPGKDIAVSKISRDPVMEFLCWGAGLCYYKHKKVSKLMRRIMKNVGKKIRLCGYI